LWNRKVWIKIAFYAGPNFCNLKKNVFLGCFVGLKLYNFEKTLLQEALLFE